MRIAVSGSHCSGKSTLIELFLAGHPDYNHETEAYELLDESLSYQPSAEDFFRQLECHAQQLQEYQSGARVIIERSPVDYVAYLKALDVLNRDDYAGQLLTGALVLAKEALASLELILFLSTRDLRTFVPREEDLELRDAVNDCLESILLNDELDLFGACKPVVIEASGTLEQRLAILEAATRAS